MGIAAAEFYSANNTEKQTLSRRIAPSDEQMEEQRQRWDSLADHLLEDLAERSGYPMRHWLQGSYKFATQVRPPRKGLEFDIDLGIYFQWSGEPDDGRYAPTQLKNMVQKSLRAYADGNSEGVIEVTQPKPRCCRIRFEGDFHIDVPTYHLDDERDARALATQDNEWEDSDPKAFYKWFVDEFDDQTRAKARRHVRYLKAWAGLKFMDAKGAPPSILLTVLVAEAVTALSPDELASDDEAFKCIVDEIIARLDDDPDVTNPVDPEEILSDRLSAPQFDAFRNKLLTLQDVATRGAAATDLLTAADIWSEAFEQFFPAPDVEVLQKSASSDGRSLVALPFDPIVHVRAVAKNNPRAFWEGTNEIGPIPKECNIEFTLANPYDLPPSARVTWTVRNEGNEAEQLNDLGHSSGAGLKKSETSAYNGMHYMDCMVKDRGKIIGYKRVPVTIRGAPVPPRNPPRRKRTWI